MITEQERDAAQAQLDALDQAKDNIRRQLVLCNTTHAHVRSITPFDFEQMIACVSESIDDGFDKAIWECKEIVRAYEAQEMAKHEAIEGRRIRE